MTESLLKTPLHDWHVRRGGRMVGFGGWEMPVQYSSIIAEHTAVRTAAGLFDVSHMGRLRFTGPGAVEFVERLLTRRTCDMQPGMIRYTLVTDAAGRILDDALVSREIDAAGSPVVGLVVNASNRCRVVAWIESQLPVSGVAFEDRTFETAMIAVQGPLALGLIGRLVTDAAEAERVAALRVYRGAEAIVAGVPATVTRTGYTGEDGVELVVPAAEAERVADAICEAGKADGLLPCGLGARDTLRLEAAMPLYGHELREDTDPFAAGLGFAIDVEGRSFPGVERFRQPAAGPAVVRVGLVVESKRPAREGHDVLAPGMESPVGTVTSGSFSPSLGVPIAMANVAAAHAAVGTPLAVRIRDAIEPARVVRLPFYSRKKT